MKLRDLFGDAEILNISVEDFDQILLQELDNAVSLFYGLYLVVCNDIGMVPKLELSEIESLPGLRGKAINNEALFNQCLIAHVPDLSDSERSAWFHVWKGAKDWLQNLGEQKFLNEDVRIIVPVLSNYWGTKVRNWAVLGTQLLKIKSYYSRPPKVATSKAYTEEDRASEDAERLLEGELVLRGFKWEPKEYVIPVQVFAEVTLGPNPLTREEFRRICDRHRTKDEIIEALVSTTREWGKLPLLLGLGAIALTAITLVVRTIAIRRRRETGLTMK